MVWIPLKVFNFQPKSMNVYQIFHQHIKVVTFQPKIHNVILFLFSNLMSESLLMKEYKICLSTDEALV
jgi:hypothetical protein